MAAASSKRCLIHLAVLTPAYAFGGSKEVFSENVLCRTNACVNPLFPGLNDLPRLEAIQWQCATHDQVSVYLSFCTGVVNYDSALPSPNTTATPVDAIVKAQDEAAMTMFFYHLSGIGYEAWESMTPRRLPDGSMTIAESPAESDDACVRSVWQMVCNTYFPKVQAGCKAGEASAYVRPCSGPGYNYISACKVECCDESVSPLFSHTVEISDGSTFVQTGYVDQLGPSAMCTGHPSAAGRSSAPHPVAFLVALFGVFAFAGAGEPERPRGHGRGFCVLSMAATLLVLATVLQGCDIDVPRHTLGNWRRQPDYLMQFEYLVHRVEGDSEAMLNSCTEKDNRIQTCSGNGYCKQMIPRPGGLAFCQCDRDWAGPECRTRRKSQTTVFLYSMFGGFLGLDYFYLGYPVVAACKMVTLGGFGFWWLADIVRMGSGPVYTGYGYRVAGDLAHWAYMVGTVSLCLVIGFIVGIEGYLSQRRQKRLDAGKAMQQFEQAAFDQDAERIRMRSASKYGATQQPTCIQKSCNSPQEHARQCPEDPVYSGAYVPGTAAPRMAPDHIRLPPVRLPPVEASALFPPL